MNGWYANWVGNKGIIKVLNVNGLPTRCATRHWNVICYRLFDTFCESIRAWIWHRAYALGNADIRQEIDNWNKLVAKHSNTYIHTYTIHVYTFEMCGVMWMFLHLLWEFCSPSFTRWTFYEQFFRVYNCIEFYIIWSLLRINLQAYALKERNSWYTHLFFSVYYNRSYILK